MKKISGKYYCQDCCEEREKEAEYYKKLCDYIYEKLGGKENSDMPFITSQIKKFKDLGYTYAQMLAVLKYMYNILDDVPPMNNVIGISLIPKYYQEAKEFYTFKKQSYEGIDINQILSRPIKIIELKRTDINEKEKKEEERRKKQENMSMIDLSIIEDDGFIDEYANTLIKESNNS